jgi:hypothetical protein
MALPVNTTAMLNNRGVTKMQPKSYQVFAQLLEGYVDEASTSLSLISGNPGGEEVIKKLHKDMKLAHDQDYRQIDKISWSELKDSYRGAWVIIQGTKGTGAIRAKSGNYEALASSGGEVRSVSDGRGGNILDFLKGEIGKLQKFYVGKNTSAVDDKKKKRADAKQGAGGTGEVNQEVLIKKFKPLWTRAITAAIADVKGHVANMIKNDAFDKAKKKLAYIESLQNGLEALEAGGQDTPEFISKAVNLAVLMAASNHYPEQTGNIERSRWGSSGYSAQFSEGPAQLLKDISAGDQKKLGTVLGFFKRTLISG